MGRQACIPGTFGPNVARLAKQRAAITRRRASVDMGIEADSLNDAIRLFLANMRTALHAAGCGTPNWPVYRPTTQTPNVREVDHADA
jgi:hypothetical protein